MAGGARDLPSGTVTFLFTDIEGSTQLVRQLGGDWPDVLNTHRRILRRAFAAHGGVEMGTEGDSFFVAFDDGPGAVAAAVEAQIQMAGEKWPANAAVRVRIGLHTGVGRVEGDDYVGIDVHHAARVAAAGHGGQTLLSEASRALTEHDLPSGVATRDLGSHSLKDMPYEEHIYQLVVPGLPNDFPPLKAGHPATSNLPVSMTSFVGRQRELDELRRLLVMSRMITVTGPAGTGKTRLLTEAARTSTDAFPDGVWFVGLESIADSRQVAAAIASVIGLREVGTKTGHDVLMDYFKARKCLLLLDNFEQVIAASPLVSELLAAAPQVNVAATSQVELRLSGEQIYPVPPMPVGAEGGQVASDAATLFVQRAASVQPGFAVTPARARTIEAICRRVDGLPLAIELAAARVRLLDVDEILRRLDSRLDLLTTGPADVAARHRTLRGAIAWSYDLLAEPEARIFRRLAVFAGGADLDAITRVCGAEREAATTDGAMLDSVDELVRHSLVWANAANGSTRFGMLETVREFARERLQESGEEVLIRARHAEWCAAMLESLAPMIKLNVAAARSAEADIDNIQAALDWATERGDVATGMRICGAASRVWERSGRLRDGLKTTKAFLAGERAPDLVPFRIRALESAGAMAYWLGDGKAAVDFYRERLTLAMDGADAAEVADAHLDLFFGNSNLAAYEEAINELGLARAAYAAIGDKDGVARCRWAETSVMVSQQRFPEALAQLKELLPVFREIGDVNYEGLTLGSLSMASLGMGDVPAADNWFREALPLADQANLVGVVNAMGAWSLLLGPSGYPRLAAKLHGAYEGLSQLYGIEMAPGLKAVAGQVAGRFGSAEQLDPAERERLVEEGRRMTIDELVDAARYELGQEPVKEYA